MTKHPCMIERFNRSLDFVLENVQAAEDAGKYLDGLVHMDQAYDALITAKSIAFRNELGKKHMKKVDRVAKRLYAVCKQF